MLLYLFRVSIQVQVLQDLKLEVFRVSIIITYLQEEISHMFYMNPNIFLSFDQELWSKVTNPFTVINYPYLTVFFCRTINKEELFVFAQAYVHIVSGIVIDEDLLLF